MKNNQLIVNLNVYGDFDMPITVVNMLAPRGMDKAEASTIVREVESECRLEREADKAIRLLKQYGFSTVRSIDLNSGGDL